MEGMKMGEPMAHMPHMPHTPHMPHMHDDMAMNDTMQGGGVMESAMTSMVMMMTMTFNNKLPFHLLFEKAKIRTRTDLVIAGFVMFFLGIAYEYIKSLRLRILDPECCQLPCCTCHKKKQTTSRKCVTKLAKKTPPCCQTNDTLDTYVTSVDVSDDEDNIEENPSKGGKRAIVLHCLETCLHGIQLLISYAIMLAVMTYNVWIVFSVVVGCIVGYFFSNWPRGGGKRRNTRKGSKLLVRNTDCH